MMQRRAPSIKKNRKTRVFIADKSRYEACLRLLGARPLKLITNSLYGDESEWAGGAWSYVQGGSSVKDKKILVNAKDTFQFSIANEHSKQDNHVHEGAVEIYVSDHPMGISVAGRSRPYKKISGIVIIPPGVIHKMKLSGITYVFQVVQNGLKIASDKKVKDSRKRVRPF